MNINRLISIAPMMDCTDKHFRYFMRLLSKNILLYTEMIHANQILFGDAQRFLQFNAEEQPVAIQLGGSDAHALMKASVIAEQFGYQEINLNVGCPSDRVQAGEFGACLMKQPQKVTDCFQAMQQSVAIPVTIKTRLGVDEFDSYDFLCEFINKIAAAGCKTFIMHARKAWLKGLSPKQNRSVPPLDYARVYQLKKDFPQLEIIINGGIKTTEEINIHLQHVDGVMLGREACQNPYLFADFDQQFYASTNAIKSREAILQDYFLYVEKQLAQGIRRNLLLRPLIGLFHAMSNGKKWRQFITTASSSEIISAHLATAI